MLPRVVSVVARTCRFVDANNRSSKHIIILSRADSNNDRSRPFERRRDYCQSQQQKNIIKKLHRRVSLNLFAYYFLLILQLHLNTVNCTSLIDRQANLASSKVATATMAFEEDVNDNINNDILIVFSDLDGTLIHYPKVNMTDIENSGTIKATVSTDENNENNNNGHRVLKLPPSSTGMRGFISSKTLVECQKIRQRGIKFVLVSGMRTSTLLSRLPYLPRADAYCSETGGRIFYPVPIPENEVDDDDNSFYTVTPKPYDGAEENDLKPFRIVEDLEWSRSMERATGSFPVNSPTIKERNGLLWDFARNLMGKGYVLDTKGYSKCFRVNRKHQPNSISDKDFEALLDGTILPWDGLATSINLSCIDFYPSESGKKNCCQYLAEKFYQDYHSNGISPSNVNNKDQKSQFLSNHAVCLCDDDNDLEMALACNHAYLPDIASESMEQVVKSHPYHFTQTGGDQVKLHGTKASELALQLVFERISSKK